MDFGLSGKVVLVTGGSKGLGLACARSFAAEGARVAIASRSAENLANAKASIATEGFDVATISANFTDPESAEHAVAETERVLGPIDVLVNSAGAAKRTPVEQLDAAAWKAAFDAKFFPYVHAQDAVLKRMRARADSNGTSPPARQIGAIVNIIGVGGRVPMATHVAGGSANAALMLATIGLAPHYAAYGIRINAINPGVILTERVEQALKLQVAALGISREEALTKGQEATPMHRYGHADEVANVAVFLASERASYVVGALIAVDGGQKAAF